MSLKTAEELTRYLRSKNESINQLLQVANSLHNNELTVYLPQKDVVLLEWLMDKMSTPNNSNWRLESQAWDLLTSIWITLGDNKTDARARVYKNHNFASILTSSLRDIANNKVNFTQLLPSLNNCLHSILTPSLHGNNVVILTRSGPQGGEINTISQQLVLEYLNCLLNLHKSDTPTDSLNSLSSFTDGLVIALDQTLTRGLKFTSKSSISTGINILSRVIVLLSLPEHFTSIDLFINKLLASIFFSAGDDSDIPSLPSAISEANKILQKNFSNLTISNGLGKFYDSMLSSPNGKSLSNKHFDELISNHPISSTTLLQIAFDRNIKIEETTISKILDIQLAESNTDWKVIKFLLEIDSQIALQSAAAKLFTSINISTTSTSLEQVASSLVKAHSQPRDMPDFFSRWKKSLVYENPVWLSKTVVDQISSNLNLLSVHQINSLIKGFLEQVESSVESPPKKRKVKSNNESSVIPLAVLVNSLSSDKVFRVKDSLLEILETDDLGSSWKIKFLIMSLSPDFVNSNNLHDSFSKHNWFDYFSSVFRVAEIYPTDNFSSIVDELFKFLNEKRKAIPEFLSAISSRWLLLVNKSFSKDHINHLIQLYLDYPDNLLELASNDYLYEQRAIINSLINAIVQDLGNKKPRIESISQALVKFPIDVFTKNIRLRLLDLLLDIKDKETSLALRKCLRLLLTRPTYSSKIEQDYHVIIKLFSSIDSELELITKDICIHVISHHMDNINSSESSKKFISSLLSKLEKMNSKSSDIWILKLSCVITMVASDHVSDEFQRNLIQSIKLYLSESKDYDEISSVLAYLFPVVKLNSSGLFSDLRKTLGNILISQKNNKPLVVNCFNILSVITDELSDLISLTALFINIGNALDDESVNENFGDCIAKFKASSVFDLLDEIILGCISSEGDVLDGFYRTLYIYGNSLPTDDDRSGKVFTKVFALFLNQMSNDSMTEKSIISFFNLIDKLLREKPMVISQHGLELILSIVYKMVSINGPSFSVEDSSHIYISLTRIVSSILLFHRHRINGRHHLIVGVFITLLKCLAKPIKSRRQICASWVHTNSGLTQPCAIAYSRLLSNLCEPPVQAVRERGGIRNLTSSATLAKKAIAKHISAILGCYIHLALQVGFNPNIRTCLWPGFYPVLDVLGKEGLKTATSIMDSSSRAFFKSLYDDYVLNGVWKEE